MQSARSPARAWIVRHAEHHEPTRLDAKATFFVTQALARHRVAEGRSGVVLIVGSQAGIVAIEDRAAHGSSKAVVAHLTLQLASGGGSTSGWIPSHRPLSRRS
jgi:NAD(P)-dependent dehydrogenase (short-subunit alcohol dehydrogenase family)